MSRTPLALANWKMAMTIAESLDFARDFQALAGKSLGTVEVILCPPFTSLWALASAQNDDSAQEDGQDTDPPSAASRPTPHAPPHPYPARRPRHGLRHRPGAHRRYLGGAAG
jgi:hypothetical protein